jgi:16S rRNA (cytosine967-C5)-methyltransferase
MKNRGAIVACDRAPDRIRLLRENVARLGVTIARVVRHDWTQAAVPKTIVSLAPFDRILVDAPCTNTGVLRRRVDARWRLSPADFLRMQKQQITLTRALVPLLKAQGVFVYSTCSLEPEENEQVVRRLLADWPGLRLEQEQWSLPFRDGFDGAYAARLVRTTQESAQLHPAAPVE